MHNNLCTKLKKNGDLICDMFSKTNEGQPSNKLRCHLTIRLEDNMFGDEQCLFCKYLKNKKFPANIYLFKVNNRNSRKWSEIYSQLTKKTLERRQGRHKL